MLDVIVGTTHPLALAQCPLSTTTFPIFLPHFAPPHFPDFFPIFSHFSPDFENGAIIGAKVGNYREPT
jgi:hypothetical protein